MKRYGSVLILVITMLLSVTSSALAGQLEPVDAANRKGDYATALRLLKPLAQQGSAAAQDRLGLMYESGSGVPIDFVEAYSWYRKAAEQSGGNAQNVLAIADARHNLGRFFSIGRGVPQDYVQAYKWYNLSCAIWPAHGEHSLQTFDCSYFREELAKKMDAAQIAEAQKLSTEWKPR